MRLRTKLNDWHKELTTLHQQREVLSREQAVNAERSRLLLLQVEQLSKERITLEEEDRNSKGPVEHIESRA